MTTQSLEFVRFQKELNKPVKIKIFNLLNKPIIKVSFNNIKFNV